jgi:hypothetical protein
MSIVHYQKTFLMRFNLVGLVIGQRGTGKSLFVTGSKYTSKPEDKKLNIPGLFDTYLNKKNMKVLVIDTLDHPAYRKLPIIKQSDFAKWNSGAVRIFMEPDNIKKLVDLTNRSNNLNNTLIIFEDAGKYTERTLPKEFKRLIIDSKQRNIDIIFMYHCFIDTPSNIFTKSDFIQLFKTEDTPHVRKNNIRLFEKVLKSHSIVNENNNKFFGKFIDTRTQ